MADDNKGAAVIGVLGSLAALGAIFLGGKKPTKPAPSMSGAKPRKGCGVCGR